MKATGRDRWWGSFELETGQAARWHIGPLELWIRRREREWRIVVRHHSEEEHATWDLTLPVDGGELPDLEEVARFAARKTSSDLEIQPVLGDRAIVTHPVNPFHVLAGEEVTLFVSTPLWVRVRTESGRRSLSEVPTMRPKDTWLGTSTLDGELCYGSRTAARLHLENLPQRPHRAITEVLLRNPSDRELLIERLGLPVVHLPLYWSPERGFCTPRITVEQGDPIELASVKIGERAPVPGAERVADARTRVSRNFFVRALGGLLG